MSSAAMSAAVRWHITAWLLSWLVRKKSRCRYQLERAPSAASRGRPQTHARVVSSRLLRPPAPLIPPLHLAAEPPGRPPSLVLILRVMCKRPSTAR
jgi:hypothetical protein